MQCYPVFLIVILVSATTHHVVASNIAIIITIAMTCIITDLASVTILSPTFIITFIVISVGRNNKITITIVEFELTRKI